MVAVIMEGKGEERGGGPRGRRSFEGGWGEGEREEGSSASSSGSLSGPGGGGGAVEDSWPEGSEVKGILLLLLLGGRLLTRDQ